LPLSLPVVKATGHPAVGLGGEPAGGPGLDVVDLAPVGGQVAELMEALPVPHLHRPSRRPVNMPGLAIESDPAESRMDTGVRAGAHRETDVAAVGVPHEIGAPGRVGAHLHGPSDQAGVVTATVAEGDLFGESGNGGVEEGDVVGDAKQYIGWNA